MSQSKYLLKKHDAGSCIVNCNMKKMTDAVYDKDELDEFYTVIQLAKLLGISKQGLQEKCEQYHLQPHRNEVREYGFVRFDARKPHCALYRKTRSTRKVEASLGEDDPWA